MQTNAELEVADFIETFKRAAFDQDVAALLSLYDENVCVFDLWQTWSYRGVASWKEAVVNWFTSTGENRDAITFDELSINLRGDFCLVHALITFSCVSPEGKTLRAMHERMTWGLEKKARWQIVHQHTSAPVSGSDFKVIFQKT